MVILGCDVSTTTVGYAFLEDGKVLDMGFIDISKKLTLKEKAVYAYEELQVNKLFNKVQKICVEDSLSSFAWGKTSTQTILTKLQNNRYSFWYGIDYMSLPI